MEYLNFINGIIGLLTPIVVEVTAKKLTGIKKVLVALIWCFIATLVSLALQNKLNFADVDSMLGTLIITLVGNGLYVIGIDVYYQMIITGIITMVAVILTLDRTKIKIVK